MAGLHKFDTIMHDTEPTPGQVLEVLDDVRTLLAAPHTAAPPCLSNPATTWEQADAFLQLSGAVPPLPPGPGPLGRVFRHARVAAARPAGALCDVLFEPPMVDQPTTLLLFAAAQAHCGVVEGLLATGAAPDARWPEAGGRTALHAAVEGTALDGALARQWGRDVREVRERRMRVIELLVRHGADPALQDLHKQCPLQLLDPGLGEADRARIMTIVLPTVGHLSRLGGPEDGTATLLRF